ncbi:MAG: NAD-dependent epimerase/dehydratase family protein, partial [Flavobacteriaceae bacterium]
MVATVLITGATGLVGKKLTSILLDKGYRVHILTTQKALSFTETNIQYFYWNPQNNKIDISCFKGVEVVINLAGSPIAQRWTKSAKASILNSRVQALNVLASAIKENNFPIKHLISASAIGIYPDSKTNYYQEED